MCGAWWGVVGQAGLGITALVTYVPTELGSLHQCGAVVLWTVALCLTNLTRAAGSRTGVNRALLSQLEKSAAAAAASAVKR
jgi:heme A synthase